MINDIEKKLTNLLKNKNHSNILIYGNINNICFYNIYKGIYKNIGDNQNEKYKNINFINNNIYTQFNLNSIKSKNKEDFIYIIKVICSTYNIFNNSKKILILYHFDSLSIYIQNILKVIIEKSTNNIIFIVLSSKNSKIIQPIKSRLLCIKSPYLNNIQKYNSIKNIVKIEDYIKYYYNYNISDIKYFYCNNIMIKNDIIYIISKYIYNVVNYNKNNILKYVKEISYYILNLSIPLEVILKEIINIIFIDKLIDNNIKYKIINFLAKSEYNYINAFNKIIHIEYIFIELSNIINI